jgi:hypothetical protein
MAFFKEALNERGSAGRGAGGNSAWIKARSFLSRATCGGGNFPVRKTVSKLFWPCSKCTGQSVRLLPCFPLPEGAERAVLAEGEVRALLVRAAHIALAHGHGLDAVLEKEILYLLLDLWVGRHVRGDPALDDRLGTVMEQGSRALPAGSRALRASSVCHASCSRPLCSREPRCSSAAWSA